MSMRPYIGGARLHGLVKTDGGLRPIACGETLRRLAGKILCANIRDEAKPFFLAQHQVGVAIPGGAEAMTLVASRLTQRLRCNAPDSDFALFKVDYVNAFNMVDRGTARDETQRVFPVLLPYVDMAYSAPAVLLFGDHKIDSSCGFHQGDPRGPALFSLVLARAVREVLERNPQFETLLRMFFLDDGVIAGPALLVREMISTLDEIGRLYGLRMNPSVCEVVGSPDHREHLETIFRGMAKFTSWDDWDLLGVPCGNHESQQAAMTAVVDNGIRRTQLVRRVGSEHPHLAYALLRQCCGFCLVNYHMRALGESPSLDRLDEATMDAMCSFTAEFEPQSRALAQLPLRLGGLGLRPAAPFARIAQLASSRSAALYWPRLTSEPPPALAELSPVLPDTSSSPLLSSALADYLDSPAKPGDRAQRTLSAQLEEDRGIGVKASLTGASLARVQSACSPCASAWLIPRAFEGAIEGWMTSGIFTLAIRHRFGLPLTSQALSCRMCGSREADIHGEHTLRCLAGGERTTLHNDLRDFLFRLASHALLRPLREHMCFGASAKRCDIFVTVGGKQLALDIAVTHFATTAGLGHAISAPGGAATRYEATVKQRKYGQAAIDNGSAFHPIVFDTLGAIGDSGLEVVRTIARRWGHRQDIGPSRAIPIVLQRLSSVLMRGICRLLLHNTVDAEQTLVPTEATASSAESARGVRATHSPSATLVDPQPVAAFGTQSSCDDAAVFGGVSS